MSSAEDKPTPPLPPRSYPRPTTARRGVTLRAISILILPMLGLFWWIISPAIVNATEQDLLAVFVGMMVVFCVMLPFIWVGLFRAALRRRVTHQEGLLWMMAIASERGLPLGPGVWVYAGYCGAGVFFALLLVFLALPLLIIGAALGASGSGAGATFFISIWAVCETMGIITLLTGAWNFRRKVQRLSDHLIDGEELYDAGIRSAGALNRSDLLFIRAGQAADRLPLALRQAIDFRRRTAQFRQSVNFRIFYMMLIVFVICNVVAFNAYFIIPKIEAIFRDFGYSELPYLTQTTFQFMSTVGPWLLLAITLTNLWLLLSASGLRIPLLPMADRVFPHIDNALALRAAALGTEGRLPVKAIFIQLIEAHPKRWMRKRLDHVYDALDRGDDLTAALRRAKLIRAADANLLNASIRAGNLSWALKQLAESWERRWVRLSRWIVHVLFPLMIVGLGLIVLGFSAAMFLPLATMIQGLASW